ncbi:hypothetical protein CRUP_023279, partial [Coryphaenoides rupestris]
SRLVLQSLHGHQQGLLLVQLALQEGVPLDGLVQTALKVLQRDNGGPGQEEQEQGQQQEEEAEEERTTRHRSSLACSSSRTYLCSCSLTLRV